jgi:phosphopantetheinyl transferase
MLLARKLITNCSSVLAEELGRATQKRKEDHNSGRLLLEECLEEWGVPVNLIEVRRTPERAPYLSWIEGTWRNNPLPGISLGHSGKWAVCALIEKGWWIGIDAEPANRGIQKNTFDMISCGDELDWLRNNPDQAIRIWTAKEAIQKSERMGMNLNPRTILLDKYIVKSLVYDDLMVSIAWRRAGENPKTPEDELLELTRAAMKDNPDFSIGCKTSRNAI